MTTADKVVLILGGLGLAGLTGAVINETVQEKEQERRELRNRQMDLEQTVREQRHDIIKMKTQMEYQEERYGTLRDQFNEHLLEDLKEKYVKEEK